MLRYSLGNYSDRGVRADPDGECEDGDEGKVRFFPELAQGVAQIVHRIAKRCRRPPLLATESLLGGFLFGRDDVDRAGAAAENELVPAAVERAFE